MTALLGSWDAGFMAIPTLPIAVPHTNRSDPVTDPARTLPTVGGAPTTPWSPAKDTMLNAAMKFRIMDDEKIDVVSCEIEIKIAGKVIKISGDPTQILSEKIIEDAVKKELTNAPNLPT